MLEVLVVGAGAEGAGAVSTGAVVGAGSLDVAVAGVVGVVVEVGGGAGGGGAADVLAVTEADA